MGMATQQEFTGLELKLARIRKRLYLYQVARQVGPSAARLSQFEGGHRRLPPDLEEKLRAALGLSEKDQRGDGE